MTNNSGAVQFKDHVGLVHLQAKKGLKWADGAGSGLNYDDMFQVASVAFCVAAKGFNPNLGLKFSTYFSTVAFSEFRKEIGRMTGVKNLNDGQRQEIEARNLENKRRAELALSPLPNCNYGLRPTPFSAIPSTFEEDVFEASIVSDARTPEENLEIKQAWECATARLSPLAALVVEWLRDPPPEMLKELACQEAYAEECSAKKVRTRGLRDGISIASVGKFLQLVGDVPKRELMLAEAELMKVVKHIEEAY